MHSCSVDLPAILYSKLLLSTTTQMLFVSASVPLSHDNPCSFLLRPYGPRQPSSFGLAALCCQRKFPQNNHDPGPSSGIYRPVISFRTVTSNYHGGNVLAGFVGGATTQVIFLCDSETDLFLRPDSAALGTRRIMMCDKKFSIASIFRLPRGLVVGRLMARSPASV